MKKILILGSLLASLYSIAGPKQDLIKAQELLNQNKVEQAVKVLKESKPVKGEEAEYLLVNYNLLTFAKTPEEAKKYLLVLTKDKNGYLPFQIEANEILINIEKNESTRNTLKNEYKNRIKLAINNLDKDVKDPEAKAQILIAYGASLYDYTGDKTGINYVTQGISLAKNNSTKAQGYVILGHYYLINKDFANAEKNFKIAMQNEKKAALLIANIYAGIDNNKAYEYAQLSLKNNPNDQNALMLATIVGSALKKDTSSYEKQLLKDLKPLELAALFYNNGITDKAEKYAKLAVDKKEYEAYTLLVTIELLKNDFDAAEKYANLAKKNNVKGADQILKSLNELKKQK